MNRRSFFTKLALAAAAFTVLPSATTYARKWTKPSVEAVLWIPNPAWETAEWELSFSRFPCDQSPVFRSCTGMSFIRYENKDGVFQRVSEQVEAP